MMDFFMWVSLAIVAIGGLCAAADRWLGWKIVTHRSHFDSAPKLSRDQDGGPADQDIPPASSE